MAESEPIGGISVSITGDYSALVGDLQQAQEIARQAGQEIGQALTQGVGTLDMSAVTDAFGKLSEDAKTAAQGMAGFGDAVEKAVESGATLAEAIQSATVEMAKAGETSQQAAGEVTKLAESTQQAATAADETKGSFEGWKEAILGIAGSVGLAVGAFEAIKEAIVSFAEEERNIIALSALTGKSFGEAAEQVDKLREVAMKFAVPEDALKQFQLRMVRFQSDTEQTTRAMEALANASAATGRDFTTVSAAFERMVIGGQAGARQLVALGISAKDLGEALGVAAEEASKAFKALEDPAQRIDVLIKAMDSLSGAGERVAQSLSGQFENMRNQMRFAFEDAGSAIAPFIAQLASLGGEILSIVSGLAKGFAELPMPIKTTAEAIGILVLSLKAAEGAAAGVGWLTTALKSLGIVGAAMAGQKFGEWLLTFTSDYKRAEEEVNKLNEVVKQSGVILERGGDNLKEWAARVFAAFEKIQSGAKDAAATMSTLAAGVSKVIETQTNAENAAKDAEAVYRELVAMQKEGAATAADVDRAYKNWQETLRALGRDIDPLAQAFKTLGIESVASLTKAYNDSVDAYNKVRAAMKDVEGGQADIDRAYMATVEALDKLDRAMGNVTRTARQFDLGKLDEFLNTEKVRSEAEAWDEMTNSLKQTSNAFQYFWKQAQSFDKLAMPDWQASQWKELARNIREVGQALRASDAFNPELLKRQVDAARQAYEMLVRSVGTSSNQIQAAWLEWQERAIDAAQKTGQAIDKDLVGALARQREQFEVTTHAADIWAQKTLETIHDISRAYLQFDEDVAGAFADLITKGSDFGEAMKNIFLDLANTIIKNLVKGALNDLMNALGYLDAKTASSMASLKDWIKIIGGGANTVAGAAQTATQAVAGLGEATQEATTAFGGVSGGAGQAAGAAGGGGGGGFLGAVGAISGVASAVAGFLQYFQGRRMEQDIGRIEVTTREIKAGLGVMSEDVHQIQNYWSAYIEMLWNPIITYLQMMTTALENIAAGGGLSGLSAPGGTVPPEDAAGGGLSGLSAPGGTVPPEDTVPESGPNGTQNVPANDASNLAQAPPISDSVGQAIVDAAGGFTDSVTEATDATQNFSSGVESASDASAEAWERLRQLSQATAQLGASFKAATAGTVEYWQGVSGFLQQMRALYVQYGFQPPAYQTAMGPISRSTPPSGNEPYPVMKPGADLANMSVEERRAWFKAHGYEDWQIDWRGMGHPAGSGGTPVSRSVPQSGNQPYPVMHPGVDLSRMSIEERQAYFRSKGYQDWQIDWRGMGHPAGSGIDAAAYRRSLMPAAPSADEQLRNRQDPMEWDWLFRANNAMALYSGGQISWEEYQSRVRLPNVAVPNMGASPTGPQDFTIHVEPDGTIIGAITKKVLEQFTAQLRQKGLVA